MIDISYSRLLITGSNSMLGHAIKRELMIPRDEDRLKRHQTTVYNTSHTHVDLTKYEACRNWFYHAQPDYVIHLATYSGNVQFNQTYPADTFFNTSQMALNVLRACQEYKVKKVVSVLSSCAIADLGDVPLKESDLWAGPPNKSIESHGFAKRVLDAYSRQLNKQYGLNAVCCILNNSFGPYDSTDLKKTKVVGALIKKFIEAKRNHRQTVECWGSGKPLREFVYCEDAAEGILQVLERYDDPNEPINITSDVEISIKDLTELIADVVGYKGEITWDTSKTDGQMRKKLDSTKMKKYLDFQITPMRDALVATVDWYERNY